MTTITAKTPTFTKPAHPAINHLLDSVHVRRVVARTILPGHALVAAVDIGVLEGDAISRASNEVLRSLEKTLKNRVSVEVKPSPLGREYTASLFYLEDPIQIRKAIEEAFKAGVTYAARRQKEVINELATAH